MQSAAVPNTAAHAPAGSAISAQDVARLAGQSVKWLAIAAAVAVPLAFSSPDALYGYSQVPKVAALHILAALVAVAWSIELLTSRPAARPGGVSLRRSPAKWPLLFATAYFLANVVSNVTSISVRGSIFGPYPGYDGYDLVSTASLVLIGAAAFTHLKSRTDFVRLLAAVALAGAAAGVYGIFQAFGFDPFGFDRFEVNGARSPLTFGNPLFAGSFLVLSLTATAGLIALVHKPFSVAGCLAYSSFIVQAAAMAATVARGPWIAATAGGIVLLVLLALAGRRGTLRRVAPAVAAGAVAALALLMAADGARSASTAERLESLSAPSAEGLNGRLSLWKSGIELGIERPWIDGGWLSTIERHLFGYGPDMYRFAFPLAAPSEHAQQLVAHPHNTFLLVWNELGLIGLIAWLGLLTALLVCGARAAMGRIGLSPWARILAAIFTAAFAAHFADMQVSVPRAGDQAVMWQFIGALLAILASGNGTSNPASSESNRSRLPGRTVVVAPVIAVLLSVAILAITVLSTARHLSADAAASGLQAVMTEGGSSTELVSAAGKASAIAPAVAYYSSLEARALGSAASSMALEPTRQYSTRLSALEALERAAMSNPVGHAEILELARLNYTLVTSGDVDRLGNAVALYEDLAVRLPNFWPVWMELAASYALADRPADGTEALDRAEYLLSLPEAYLRDDPASQRNIDAVRGALAAAESRAQGG